MGYNTHYELDVVIAQSDPVQLEKFREDQSNGKTFGSYQLDLGQDWDAPMKWYSWGKDMEELSKEYPNVMFVLYGEGEESGDIWLAYIMNGVIEEVRAQIIFDQPDLSKFPRVDLIAQQKKELAEKRAAPIAEQERIEQEIDKLTET